LHHVIGLDLDGHVRPLVVGHLRFHNPCMGYGPWKSRVSFRA
jgi:hypothetical protein